MFTLILIRCHWKRSSEDVLLTISQPQLKQLELSRNYGQAAMLQRAYAASHDIKVDPYLRRSNLSKSNTANTNRQEAAKADKISRNGQHCAG